MTSSAAKAYANDFIKRYGKVEELKIDSKRNRIELVCQLNGEADAIGVTMGDFATTKVAATFRLANVVFNTIANLTTQDAQVQCFENVAAHLDPGGCFVVEIGVPELQRLPPGETVRAFTVSSTRLGFDEYDIANQGLVSHHYWMVDGRADEWSVPFRYVWPAELDLMARLAGMTLRERWSSWTREPFTSDSTKHISVWEKANVTTRGGQSRG